MLTAAINFSFTGSQRRTRSFLRPGVGNAIAAAFAKPALREQFPRRKTEKDGVQEREKERDAAREGGRRRKGKKPDRADSFPHVTGIRGAGNRRCLKRAETDCKWSKRASAARASFRERFVARKFDGRRTIYDFSWIPRTARGATFVCARHRD